MSRRYHPRIVSGFATHATFQCFAAEPLADFCERRALRISHPQSLGQLRSQNAVLRCQVLVLEEQLLGHQSSHVR